MILTLSPITFHKGNVQKVFEMNNTLFNHNKKEFLQNAPYPQ